MLFSVGKDTFFTVSVADVAALVTLAPMQQSSKAVFVPSTSKGLSLGRPAVTGPATEQLGGKSNNKRWRDTLKLAKSARVKKPVPEAVFTEIPRGASFTKASGDAKAAGPGGCFH